nr:glycosyltransferase family 2 protein [Ramlibacter sp.]
MGSPSLRAFLANSIVNAGLSGAAPTANGDITISVVSHGQGAMVEALLRQIAAVHDPRVVHVVLTHNLPAASVRRPEGGWPWRLTEIFNDTPAGFSTNHNKAFSRCDSALYCVLNPDIDITDAGIWAQLAQAAEQPGIGMAYPVLLSPDGSRQSNEREALTPLALLRRHVLKQPQRVADWVSAACWLVRSDAWRQLGGLDDSFFMYCEDADFCFRLQLAGWRMARAEARAVHYGGWHSRQFGPHLAWHVRSLLRLWTQPPLHRYLAAQAKARQ